MADICSRCGAALPPAATACPICKSPTSVEKSIRQLLDSQLQSVSGNGRTEPPKPVSTGTAWSVLGSPSGGREYISPQLPRAETPPPPLPERADGSPPPSPPIYKKDDSGQPSLPQNTTSAPPAEPTLDSAQPPADMPHGELERAIDGGGSAKKMSSSPFRSGLILTIAVLFFAVVLGVATAVFWVAPALLDTPSSSTDDYIKYLSGTWVSDEFTFTDSADNRRCEVFTVTPDGGFTLSTVIPGDNPNETINELKPESSISGTLMLYPAEHRISLLYSENGSNLFYSRYFVEKNDGEMILREYYDDDRTAFYDMKFRKMA